MNTNFSSFSEIISCLRGLNLIENEDNKVSFFPFDNEGEARENLSDLYLGPFSYTYEPLPGEKKIKWVLIRKKT